MKNWLKKYRFYFLIFISVVLVNLFVLRLSFVSGESMVPTLHDGSCVLLWELAYTPQNGDIVITNADNPLSANLIKRVIAVSGQRVQLTGSQVYVDGALLEEPYLNPKEPAFYADMDFIVPEGSCFLMGDNRKFSKDSRELGCLSNKDILGKVIFRFY
jgi:signal peptidase I